MKINFKVRFKNPVFIAQIILSIFAPVLAYNGLTVQDLTSWSAVFGLIVQALQNPYILALIAVSVFNAINDPTTKGIVDSERAMTYQKPKGSE